MATRKQLEHAIRAATSIVQQKGIIIVGSQSILGSWPEEKLPERTTLSREFDMAPLDDEQSEILADKIYAVTGEMSQFDQTHHFYLDGVGINTAVLPGGFDARLVPVKTDNTNGAVGLCLEPHDLCVAKLIASRTKDREFVLSLVEAQLVDPRVINERLYSTSALEHKINRAHSFLADSIETWNLLGLTPADPQPYPAVGAMQIPDLGRWEGLQVPDPDDPEAW